MPIEVHVSQKPARRHAALICTVVLLFGSLALAQHVVVVRAKDLLGERIQGGDWPISFQPPAGFHHVPPASEEPGDLYLVHRDFIRVFIGAMPFDDDQDATDICTEIWSELAPELPTNYTPPSPQRRSIAFIGTGGFEIVDVHRGIAIRAALLDAERAVVVILVSRRLPLQGHLIRLFRAVCESVRRSD